MIAGLVALRILAHHAGDVRLRPRRAGNIGRRGKQPIELGDKRLVAAVQIDQALHVVRNAEAGLPSIGFNVIGILDVGPKWIAPLAVLVLGRMNPVDGS